MVRCVVAAAMAALMIACPDPDDPTGDRYEIDGLSVVLEDGEGPTPLDMQLAVEVFRREVQTEFAISRETEASAWDALAEVRWTGDAVAEGGTYDTDVAKIRMQWQGCVLEGPLYLRMIEHYLFVTTGSLTHLGFREWADELTAETKPILCN